jgi:hypothetical protein
MHVDGDIGFAQLYDVKKKQLISFFIRSTKIINVSNLYLRKFVQSQNLIHTTQKYHYLIVIVLKIVIQTFSLVSIIIEVNL